MSKGWIFYFGILFGILVVALPMFTLGGMNYNAGRRACEREYNEAQYQDGYSDAMKFMKLYTPLTYPENSCKEDLNPSYKRGYQAGYKAAYEEVGVAPPTVHFPEL